MNEPFDPKNASIGDRIKFEHLPGTVTKIDENGYAKIVFDHWSASDKQNYTFPFEHYGVGGFWKKYASRTVWIYRKPQTISKAMFNALIKGDDRGIRDVS